MFGEIAHKPGCSLKPVVVGKKCAECGGPGFGAGFRHTPGCSKNPVRVVDGLSLPIGSVCKTGVPGVLPLRSYAPANPNIPLPSGEVLLKSPAAMGAPAPPVTDKMAERLLTALASIINGKVEAVREVTNGITIRVFRKLGEGQQLAFINRVWNKICTVHDFNTLGSAMSDPVSDDMDGPTLPSSVCPLAPGMNQFKKRLKGQQPFREFGIGFRVDGADQGSIDRILGQGMTQQRENAAFMLGPRRGLRLDATILSDISRARCWTGNNDIFNETAVCVSRNFFGGTAFPERETNGTCYLWAVYCGDLKGFDTEAYQLGLPNSRQWRPGEKAFRFIPVSNILGYIQIDRRGASKKGGWSVDITTQAAWTFTGKPTVKQRTYLEDELAAWKGGSYTIPPAYDFAT